MRMCVVRACVCAWCVRVCMCVCESELVSVCVCVGACVRARARARVRVYVLFAMDSHHSFIIPWIFKRRVPLREGIELMFVNSPHFRRHFVDLTRGTESGKQLTCIQSTESGKQLTCIQSTESKRPFIAIQSVFRSVSRR